MSGGGAKNCYCYTCGKHFQYLGIASHRALRHLQRGEECTIRYTHGEIKTHTPKARRLPDD